MTPEQDREWRRNWRATQKAALTITEWPCPTCGTIRTTEEALRVHRAIIHPEQHAAA